MDGQCELVCGAFSADPARSRESGASLFLPAARCYGDYAEMMRAERALPAEVRMDFVVICTPNHVHFGPAKLALESGFHVLSDKPATFNLAEAVELQRIVRRTGLLYGLTHSYMGYPMVKEVRWRSPVATS
jgi:predicted dehydrogenase